LVPRYVRYATSAVVATAIIVGAVLITKALTAGPASPTLDSNSLPIGPVSYDFIHARPDASLRYPGSTIFSPFGTGERIDPVTGKQGAYIGAVMTTSASPDQIYEWYGTQLRGLGWTSLGAASRLGTQVSAQRYERGTRELFLVAIDDPTLLQATIGRAPPPSVTVYEYTYAIDPSSSR
jgi:hypothetical protein